MSSRADTLALVGLVSSYREGRLIQGAVRSLLEAELDDVYVCEGPAGPPLTADVPDTDLGALGDQVVYTEGRWRTDARKRTAMLERAQRDHGGGPLWGIWLDGDEVLFNGVYLRDWLQVLAWKEQLEDMDPFLGRPLRIVELDGSVGWARHKLMRLDLIRRYDVSAASFVNAHGVLQGAGTVRDAYSDWRRPRDPYFKADQIVIVPPIPGEPYLLHRSALRHPVRAALRLHHQEAEEYERRKAPA